MTEDEPALRVDHQRVRALFAAARSITGVAGWGEVFRSAFSLFPLVDHVRRNVREEQVSTLLYPDWSFRPYETFGENLWFRVRWNEFIKFRTEAFEFTEGSHRYSYD